MGHGRWSAAGAVSGAVAGAVWRGGLVLVMLGLAALLAGPVAAGLTFSWAMESETPERYPAGSDGGPNYFPPTTTFRSTAQAHSGSYVSVPPTPR